MNASIFAADVWRHFLRSRINAMSRLTESLVWTCWKHVTEFQIDVRRSGEGLERREKRANWMRATNKMGERRFWKVSQSVNVGTGGWTYQIIRKTIDARLATSVSARREVLAAVAGRMQGTTASATMRRWGDGGGVKTTRRVDLISTYCRWDFVHARDCDGNYFTLGSSFAGYADIINPSSPLQL